MLRHCDEFEDALLDRLVLRSGLVAEHDDGCAEVMIRLLGGLMDQFGTSIVLLSFLEHLDVSDFEHHEIIRIADQLDDYEGQV